jgi:glyoxylase-like metal-dependent hydrolase (beta-lactamase superfamily II)
MVRLRLTAPIFALAGAMSLIGAQAPALEPAASVLRRAVDADDDPAPFDPVPAIARGPAIPSVGYLVQEVKDGLYWLTDGVYACMFLTTGSGVILVDAPQSLGPHLLEAIASVSDEPITYIVYSHHHADHIGAAGVLPKTATYIAHRDTAALLREEADPNRPVPSITFSEHYTLSVGTQTLMLDYHGPNHDVGNIFIYAPRQKVLMLVDVIWPGWAPFDRLGSPVDSRGYLAAHDLALRYDFDALIGGHVNRLGTRADVINDRMYLADLEANASAALQAFDPRTLVGQISDPSNAWALADALLEAWPQRCVEDTLAKWRGRLGGVDVFVRANCSAMQDALRAGDLSMRPQSFADFKVGGPPAPSPDRRSGLRSSRRCPARCPTGPAGSRPRCS